MVLFPRLKLKIVIAFSFFPMELIIKVIALMASLKGKEVFINMGKIFMNSSFSM